MTASDVVNAIRTETCRSRPAVSGRNRRPRGHRIQCTLNALGRLETVAQFKRIVVKARPAPAGVQPGATSKHYRGRGRGPRPPRRRPARLRHRRSRRPTPPCAPSCFWAIMARRPNSPARTARRSPAPSTSSPRSGWRSSPFPARMRLSMSRIARQGQARPAQEAVPAGRRLRGALTTLRPSSGSL